MQSGRRRKKRRKKDAPSSQKLTWVKSRGQSPLMCLQAADLRICIGEYRRAVIKRAKARKKRM